MEVTGEDIFERALDWGFESPYEYIMEVLQENLVKQKEGTAYNFKTADGGLKKLTWEVHRNAFNLIATCVFHPTSEVEFGLDLQEVLDYLLAENMKLKEDAKEKTIMFHSMKTEAEKCLEQSERMKEDVKKLESDLYKKFVLVLNSKKAKLRELKAEVDSLKAGKR